MASEVDVANLALSFVGVTAGINALTDDSAQAYQCNLWIDQSREILLRAHNWTFSTKRAALTSISYDSDDSVLFQTSFSHRYQYPTDALKIQYVTAPEGSSTVAYPFSVENSPVVDNRRIVLCNIEDAVGVYTVDHDDYTTMPSIFIQPLSVLLAANIAYGLTGMMEKTQELNQMYLTTLQMYTSQDASEGTTNRLPEADWIQQRTQ